VSTTAGVATRRAPGRDAPRAPLQARFAVVLLLPLGLAAQSIALASVPGAPAWHAWLPFLAIHALVPLLDAWVGADGRPAAPGRPHPLNRALPLACLPAWLAAFALAAWAAGGLDGWAWWGLAASAGATGGIVAINVGHELVHRSARGERAVGGLLLASVGYGPFKVEHVRGHHLRVATPEDGATARRGEGLWAFVPRSVAATFVHGWRLDAARIAAAHPGAGPLSRALRNETLAWTLAALAFGATLGLAFGAAAAAFWAVASTIAVLELEVVNYVEHYGLERARRPDGRWEPVDERHSWNADTAVVNAFLLNLQRHSHHHAHGGTPYVALSSAPHAPQLPAGYGAMVLLALVPPAWRAVMDPRLDRWRAAAAG
jgi:alkane 1-monooxygenase